MSKKYTVYATMTCLMLLALILLIVLIADMILQLDGQLVVGTLLCCVACLPMWLILGKALSQYYESDAKRRNRRKLIIVPYTEPTKTEMSEPLTQHRIADDTKIYKSQSGDVELRRVISALEADTQIYSIRNK